LSFDVFEHELAYSQLADLDDADFELAAVRALPR
jgi:hypothetical protein